MKLAFYGICVYFNLNHNAVSREATGTAVTRHLKLILQSHTND
jgi:hypothetical protein